MLLSSDSRRTVEAVGRRLEVKRVLARVMPAEKAEEIRRLQEEVAPVAMAGSSLNVVTNSLRLRRETSGLSGNGDEVRGKEGDRGSGLQR